MEKRICECGCGGEIIPKRTHKYVQPRFIAGHNTRTDSKTGKVRHAYTPKPEEIPSGLCECGCGDETPIATFTERKSRIFRGYPVPRLPFHCPYKSGADNHRWKGGRIYNNGYVLLRMPDDPRSDSKGYVPEHRLVWEEANGQTLEPGMHVHHINGITDDNRPENLIALTKAQHTREHNIEENRARHLRGRERGRHKKLVA